MNGRRLGYEIARAAVAARMQHDLEKALARGMVGLAVVEIFEQLGFEAPPVPPLPDDQKYAWATGGPIKSGEPVYLVGDVPGWVEREFMFPNVAGRERARRLAECFGPFAGPTPEFVVPVRGIRKPWSPPTIKRLRAGSAEGGRGHFPDGGHCPRGS